MIHDNIKEAVEKALNSGSLKATFRKSCGFDAGPSPGVDTGTDSGGSASTDVQDTRYSLRLRFQDLRGLVRTKVLGQLPQPAPITADEILTAALNQLTLATPGTFDACYERFVIMATVAASDAILVYSEPFPIAPFVDSEFRVDERYTIFESESGVSIDLVGCLPHSSGVQDPDPYKWEQLSSAIGISTRCWFANVGGHCSRAALAEIVRVVRPALESVFSCAMDTGMLKLQQRDPEESELAAQRDRAIRFARWALRGLFGSTKATLEHRVGNAIHLLAVADGNSHEAVRFSLCIAAIEALVCTSRSGISDELSRNVAVLLVPDGKSRVESARKNLKALYDHRSNVLHGEVVHVPSIDVWRARGTVSAVLRAIWEWSEYAPRDDDGQSMSKEFFQQLRLADATGQPMPGVGYSNVPRSAPHGD